MYTRLQIVLYLLNHVLYVIICAEYESDIPMINVIYRYTIYYIIAIKSIVEEHIIFLPTRPLHVLPSQIRTFRAHRCSSVERVDRKTNKSPKPRR